MWFMFYNLMMVVFEVYSECTSHIGLILLAHLPINFSWGSFMNKCNVFVMDNYISTFFSLAKAKYLYPVV